MHLKRVTVIADDVHIRAWAETGIASLDVTIHYCPLEGLESRLSSDAGDAVIVDGRRLPTEAVALAEKAAAGSDIKLLLVVAPSALDSLRLPVRFPADFIVEGASTAELAARVRQLLWPGEEVSTDEIIRVDDLALNLATYQAYVRSEPVEFTYLEYALFAFLVTHPNRVYSREVLLSRVWGTDYFGGARTVDVHVRRVRSKLGPEVAARLETVRNVGYLWRI
jgi:DNA-binding response OmpR family regulator